MISCKILQGSTVEKKHLEMSHDITDKQGHEVAFLEASLQQAFTVWRRGHESCFSMPLLQPPDHTQQAQDFSQSLISFQNNMLGMEAGEVNYFFCSIQ